MKQAIPNLQTYRKGAGERLPDWGRLEASIYGTDVSRQMMRISMMNLVLHGIRGARLKRANVLSEMSGLSEDDLARRYKVILSNPPFAGQIPKESVRADLPSRARDRDRAREAAQGDRGVTPKPVRRKASAALTRRASVSGPVPSGSEPYRGLVGGIEALLEQARRTLARAVNAILTATYWEIGRRIVEYEQGGKARSEYGEALLKRLAADLTARFGRGFGVDNLERFRSFYLAWPDDRISATPSRKSLASQNRPTPSGKSDAAILRTPSEESTLAQVAARFPLPWSAYVRLLAVKNEHARGFYETEALRLQAAGPFSVVS